MYTYECTKCGHEWQETQLFSDILWDGYIPGHCDMCGAKGVPTNTRKDDKDAHTEHEN